MMSKENHKWNLHLTHKTDAHCNTKPTRRCSCFGNRDLYDPRDKLQKRLRIKKKNTIKNALKDPYDDYTIPFITRTVPLRLGSHNRPSRCGSEDIRKQKIF